MRSPCSLLAMTLGVRAADAGGASDEPAAAGVVAVLRMAEETLVPFVPGPASA